MRAGRPPRFGKQPHEGGDALDWQKAIQAVRDARKAHKAWVERAEALVRGLPLEKEQVPVLPTDCELGKWYYGEGQELQDLESFRALEPVHDELHHIYMEIFRLLFGEPEISLLDRWLGREREVKERQRRQAEALLPRLRARSETIVHLLTQLEVDIRLRAMRAKTR